MQIRVKRFVDHTGIISVNRVMFDVSPIYIGRFVCVYLPEMRIEVARGTQPPKERRLFLLFCHLTGQNPADFQEGSNRQDVIDRWRQGFEADLRRQHTEAIEISVEFAADPANLMRVRGRETPGCQVVAGGRL